ncbi:hypothetical protein CDAR_70911 [Caerostris darwini]|uniref:Uncharacterized protein n=1 Tax=Caerostris darwini TaxID=1538125 RepID=A0AAV4WHY1_9ARAC|nr:hypothetical protein CDAR_70911 [Caerostris darwini]
MRPKIDASLCTRHTVTRIDHFARRLRNRENTARNSPSLIYNATQRLMVGAFLSGDSAALSADGRGILGGSTLGLRRKKGIQQDCLWRQGRELRGGPQNSHG